MSAHPERFHALDATRAFALLLGVVFHAAWFYVPFPVRAAVTDVGANDFFGWFFVASHTFRMQLFFLIAGFFARLVVEKRGTGAFVKNRLMRIGLPLVVGWFLLVPLFYATWFWGYVESGQFPEDVPPAGLALFLMVSGRVFVPRDMGGAFIFVHLWFLYFLLLMYVIVLGLRPVVRRLVRGGIERVDDAVSWLAGSSWGPVVLSLVFLGPMYFMNGWVGVTTPSESLIPERTALAVYLGFFVSGWLLHRVAGRLGLFFGGWRVFLVVGLLGSCGIYWVNREMVMERDTGASAPAIGFADVRDWEVFGRSLEKMGGADEAGQRFWAKLGEQMQGYAGRAGELSKDERAGMLMAISKLLAEPELFTADVPEEKAEGPPPMVPMDRVVMAANREILDRYLDGVSGVVAREQGWYRWWKLGYAWLYSLTMCSLVWASLGFFQVFSSGFSPAWRYVADSSYWVYLLHIPVVPALEILIFRWEMTVWVKFPLLMVVSFFLLYLSYHVLVRSTFIGKLLNGRKYPFHWNPLRSVSGK